MEGPQKSKYRTTIDPAIPLLGIHPDKTTIQKDTCTPMFIATLFAIAKTRKQTKCPSQMNGLRRCGMKCYSVIKKNKIMPFAAT